jgi:CheY-like chemotaxis protein
MSGLPKKPRPRIFFCYPRRQAAAHTGRIRDRLLDDFDCFVDVNSVSPGDEFPESITSNVRQCRVLLAVIGPNWIGKTGTRRRIDDSRDFVRREIEIALEQRIPVIPILIDGAGMPAEANLPPSLARLAHYNAIEVDQGPDFDHQVDRLVKAIKRFLLASEPGTPAHESEALRTASPARNELQRGPNSRSSEQAIVRSTRRRSTVGLVATPGSSSNQSPTGRVLILDGNDSDRNGYRKLLTVRFPDLTVETAPNSLDAIKAAESGKLDVIVADLGSYGHYDAGYEALLELKNVDPGTEVIVITDFPQFEQAVRRMRAGCLDYIYKTRVGPEALSEGVERAIQLAGSSARRRTLVEQLILADWEMMRPCPDKIRQGRYLESLMALLFGSIPKWNVQHHVRVSNEEFSLLIHNEQDDNFWTRRGNFILVECKNWSGGRLPGRAEFDTFLHTIERRGPEYCRLGIFVSIGGVSHGFEEEARRRAGKEAVIIVIDLQGIWELICAPDRGDWLKHRVQERLFG